MPCRATNYSDSSVHFPRNVASTEVFSSISNASRTEAFGTRFAASIAGNILMERLIRLAVVTIVLGALALARDLVRMLRLE